MTTDSAEIGTINHWFDGGERSGASNRTLDVTNPATGQVTGRVVFADEADATP